MASEAKLAVKTELDGRVITYIFGDSSRATVDAWVAQFTHYLESTQRIDELLILLDFTASANAFTPYFSGRALTGYPCLSHPTRENGIHSRSALHRQRRSVFFEDAKKKIYPPSLYNL